MPDYITLTNGTLQAQIRPKRRKLRGLSMQISLFCTMPIPRIWNGCPLPFSKCRSFKGGKTIITAKSTGYRNTGFFA